MTKYLVIISLVMCQFITAQDGKLFCGSTYKHGHNGMELIVTSKKETIIISTFNSKLEIKNEIAEKVYNYYTDHKNPIFKNGDTLIIIGEDAKVTGKINIRKKGNLILLDFYYDRIQWKTGLVEAFEG